MAGHHGALDPGAAVFQRERNVDLVERRSAEAQVSLDVDRPATAAAQRLLEVDAENGAIRRFERRRPGQAGDRGGGRSAGGLDVKSRSAPPRRHGLGQIGDRGAEVGVDQFAARADLEVPPKMGGGFALEAAAIGRGVDQKSC